MTNKSAWEEKLDYNSTDMGEMGKFIRVEYAKNILNQAISKREQEIAVEVKSLISAKEMTPPFLFDGRGQETDAPAFYQEQIAAATKTIIAYEKRMTLKISRLVFPSEPLLF